MFLLFSQFDDGAFFAIALHHVAKIYSSFKCPHYARQTVFITLGNQNNSQTTKFSKLKTGKCKFETEKKYR